MKRVVGQSPENTGQTVGRRKRIAQIMPQLRRQIPGMFDDGMPAERIAEQFSVPKTEVLEDLIRDTRAVIRKPPQSARSVAYAGLRIVGGRP